MLREIVLWWARQMRTFVPQRLLPNGDRMAALVVTIGSRHVTVSSRHGARETPLGEYHPDSGGLVSAIAETRRRPRHIIIRAEPGTLLERPVDLPLAAERDLNRVIGYEMDRLTPFGASDVVWHAAVVKRDVAQRQLRVRLSLVPRRALQPCLDLLRRAGVAPTWVEASAADGTLRRIALAASRRERGGRKSIRAMTGVVAALAIAAVVTPFITQALSRAATERAIAALAPKVDRVEALRQRIAAKVVNADALTAEQSHVGDALQVLAAVTDIVPDDSYLTELTLHGGKLGLSGQSPAAARLILALSADPAFRNPAFAAPVTRTQDGHAEEFVIHAELAP
ncbi:MAG TPA: PilN domain-containing protein [Acetobacteraceae bacterium]|jgi:general secretion pathway protein L|nr:PilN domain-containing protein [Acetobacteraceae bacterium]